MSLSPDMLQLGIPHQERARMSEPQYQLLRPGEYLDPPGAPYALLRDVHGHSKAIVHGGPSGRVVLHLITGTLRNEEEAPGLVARLNWAVSHGYNPKESPE